MATATLLRRPIRSPPFPRSKLSDAAVAVSWCGRTFSTTPIILAECTDTPTISGRLASFICLSPFAQHLYFASGTWHWNGVFWGTGTGYVDTHWAGGIIIGETWAPTTGVKQYFGMGKPRHFASRRITRMVGPGPVSQELGAASE